MRKAPALSRFVAPLIVSGVLLVGCGQPTHPAQPLGAGAGQAAAMGAPGEPLAAGIAPEGRLSPAPDSLVPGSLYRNPANGRDEVVVADIRRSAVLIGDSQSEPVNGWPRQALAALGYDVVFCGKGGTGFVASNGTTGNYIDALHRGDWHLPYGEAPLVVIQGGGNDATRGASDAEIAENAQRLIATVRQRYPSARLAMVGTLARGSDHGGGRRTEVDALLGTVAAVHGIPFVSVGDWLTRYGLTQHLADDVHMDDAGHDALGALLSTRLDALGLAAPEI